MANKKRLTMLAFVAAMLMLGALAACSAGSQSADNSASGASTSPAATSEIATFSTPTDFTSEEARQAMLAKAADFPSKFDLRDVDGHHPRRSGLKANAAGVLSGSKT